MARKRLQLARIVNEKCRLSALRKRRIGLFKKLEQLNTLCGSDAFTVIYDPIGNSRLQAWPAIDEARRLAELYESLPEDGKPEKTVEPNTFLSQEILKMIKKTVKLSAQNKEKEMGLLWSELDKGIKTFDNLGMNQLCDLKKFLEEKMAEACERKDELEQQPLRIANHGGGIDYKEWDRWYAEMLKNSSYVASTSYTMPSHIEFEMECAMGFDYDSHQEIVILSDSDTVSD